MVPVRGGSSLVHHELTQKRSWFSNYPKAGVFTLLLACIIVAFSACDGDGTGGRSLSMTHDTSSTPNARDGQANYVTFSGKDAEGQVVYNSTAAFSDSHTLTNVPADVKSITIEYHHANGTVWATSTVSVDPNVNSPLTAAASPIPNTITVELVNDTNNTGGNEKMFVLFDTPKSTGDVSGINILTDSGGAKANGKGLPMSTLTSTGNWTSTYTGKSRKVYTFTVTDVDTGRLTFSYDDPISIVNGAAPTSKSPIRYDKMELTFKPTDPKDLSKGSSGGGNLTAIDFYAIPIEVQVTHAGDNSPDPLQTKTFYASTPKILESLLAMNSSVNDAFLNKSGGKFIFSSETTDFSTFARILSPNTIAASKTSGSPAPYPSFSSYLASLVDKEYKVNGQQFGGYKYTAKFENEGVDGYKITCTGSVTNDQVAKPPAPALPGPTDNATVTIHLPADQLDFYIYATVVNKDSYSIAGYEFKDSKTIDPQTGKPTYTAQDMVNAANASAYGALVGDLQAALNFGYMGGRFDTGSPQDISVFYASVMLPYAYPYGGARSTSQTINDGFYNPYAGLFYYASDAYGHPFSDRIAAASPLYSLTSGDTVRITILDDNRLDTPFVSSSEIKDTSLKVSWPTMKNATGYDVKVSPGSASCSPTLSGDTQSCTISGLDAGTSYLISVRAKGTKDSAAITSAILPIQAMTSGTATPVSGGVFNISFGVNLPVAPPIPGMTAYVNGQEASGGPQASVQGSLGQNIIGMEIKDSSNEVVYSTNYFVTVSQPAGIPADKFDIGPLYLEYGLTPLTAAGPPKTPPFDKGGGLVIGTPFTPKPYYMFFPTVFPSGQ